MTRKSIDQGVHQTTGFINSEKINDAGTWSLGLMQMSFFYREKPWYAGQFVRKLTPKIDIPKGAILFISTVLNRLRPLFLSILIRDIDKIFKVTKIRLPALPDNGIDFSFMESFVNTLQAERVKSLYHYLTVSDLLNYKLSKNEQSALKSFCNKEILFGDFQFDSIFNKIKQGRRLKKADQVPGDIPFVMSGTTNNGVVGYVSNPVSKFPSNSITIDIFGNCFYRNYEFGAGDDTGVYWNDSIQLDENSMLFLTSSMEKTLQRFCSYGQKLRSSKAGGFKMRLPVTEKCPDYKMMNNLISAIKKLVIKDLVLYTERNIQKMV